MTKMPALERFVEEYGQSWLLWWKSLQPEWRDMSAWPLVRGLGDPDGTETWGALKGGGHNCIYLAVVALSWWLQASIDDSAASSNNTGAILEAIRDVSWVLRAMSS